MSVNERAFTNCCGARILTNFNHLFEDSWGMNASVEIRKKALVEELKRYFKNKRQRNFVVYAVLNPTQTWAEPTLEENGFVLMAKVTNPNTGHLLLHYIYTPKDLTKS